MILGANALQKRCDVCKWFAPAAVDCTHALAMLDRHLVLDGATWVGKNLIYRLPAMTSNSTTTTAHFRQYKQRPTGNIPLSRRLYPPMVVFV
jgi:hypothetical protein